jgi:predicted ATPase/DNA-binding CsgD family transcriptional regulator
LDPSAATDLVVSLNAVSANPRPIPLRSLPLEQPRLDVVELGAGKDLPKPLTSLIGREADIATACRLLLDNGVRLLTLTGPGGVGKTRLALRIADEVATAFPDGVVFVPLAPITNPDLVLPAIARELGLQDAQTRGPLDLIIDFLSRRRFLLVLDNFEQVRAAAPELVELLSACDDLVILVTSRALLRISGEQRFPVSPLGLPEDGRRRTEDGGRKTGIRGRRRQDATAVDRAIEQSAAVQLFIARAQASDPEFTLDTENAAAIAEICRRLDGLPLAIELAAARVPMLSPSELRARFDRALPHLSDGPLDAPHRLRTMRQAIAWSYELLDDAEQALFRRLAVFVGGFTLEAAEYVGGDDFVLGGDGGFATPSVFELMSTLLDHSLLRRIAQFDGEPRFALLETVREFGLEALAASGEETRPSGGDSAARRAPGGREGLGGGPGLGGEISARDAHAAYFLALAERAEAELQDAAWEAWVARLISELPNVRAALDYLREQGDGERAVRLAGALCLFWTQPSYIREGRAWLEMAVALPGADRAPEALATALNAIGVVAQWQYDFPCIETALNRALAIRRDMGDELGAAEVLGNLGNAALDSGEFERAEALLTSCLPVYESHCKTFWVGETLTLLGHTARAHGNHDRSVAYHEEAVAVLRQLPGKNKLADALISLGWAELMRGTLAQSRTAYREGLALAEASNDRLRMGRGVCGAAGLAAGDAPTVAAQLFGAAAAQRDDEQIQLKPTIQAELERLTARVRDALGDAAFAAAWAAGRSLPLEDAVVEAKAILEETWRAERAAALITPCPPASASANGPRLTPREWQVLHLLASGRADKEIAAELFISSRTASSHVAAIIAKLGVSSRTAAVAIAARGLLA